MTTRLTTDLQVESLICSRVDYTQSPHIYYYRCKVKFKSHQGYNGYNEVTAVYGRLNVTSGRLDLYDTLNGDVAPFLSLMLFTVIH